MIWENGVCKYMNAFNIFWEKGLWRNGNWYGSSFEFNGSVDSDYVKQILFRGMSWSGTSSTHIWNIFLNNEEKETQILSAAADTPTYTPPIYAVMYSGPAAPGGFDVGGGGGGS